MVGGLGRWLLSSRRKRHVLLSCAAVLSAAPQLQEQLGNISDVPDRRELRTQDTDFTVFRCANANQGVGTTAGCGAPVVSRGWGHQGFERPCFNYGLRSIAARCAMVGAADQQGPRSRSCDTDGVP